MGCNDNEADVDVKKELNREAPAPGFVPVEFAPGQHGIISSGTAVWLIERYGPIIAELLQQVLLSKAESRGVLPSDMSGLFSANALVSVLAAKVVPEVVDRAADWLVANAGHAAELITSRLDGRSDVASKIAADLVRTYGPAAVLFLAEQIRAHRDAIVASVLALLKSPAGASVIAAALAGK